jgi:hypothetical protein
MYGYLDESGTPGVADNENDFLVASLVLLDDEQAANRCSAAIDRLRTRLGKTPTYEFHRSHNASVNQTGFLKLLPSLEFRFITVAIKKNHSRRHASYGHLAELLVREIKSQPNKINVKMDSNPTLCTELKKQIKLAKLRNVRVKEAKSQSENLIQLADYVVNLSSKKAKQLPKSIEWYRPIAKKQTAFIEITE